MIAIIFRRYFRGCGCQTQFYSMSCIHRHRHSKQLVHTGLVSMNVYECLITVYYFLLAEIMKSLTFLS